MSKIVDIIKYEGDNSTFIWKHPAEDFNYMSQLVVHESQEAIFFMNGQALDLFGPGRHTLETQNIPVLGKALNKVTGDKSPFHCEVYFINKTVQMALKWGTDSKVRFIDPLTGVPLEIGACGEMNLQVSDSRKLLVKLVGTMKGIAWEANREGFTKSLTDSFKPLISTAVKTNLASALKQSEIDILEIDERLEELSGTLCEKLIPGFEEYGLTIPQFYVTTVVLPENDPNFKKIRELHTISFQKKMVEASREIELERQTTETEIAKREAERELIKAQTEAQAAKMAGFAEAEIMAAKGITEKDYVQADVQKAFAEGLGNMGSGGSAGGGMMGDIVGLGVGLQAANAMSGQLGGIFNGLAGGSQEAPQQSNVKCANCGNTLPQNAKFCLECGTKVENLSENEIICPSCGKKTAKGKFCMECGASLIVKCAKCGAEIPNGAKFCLECGEKL
ncbi:MAG: SPFH domain-containing protein [Clostridia bacterium]|nr:SPFH domain-containing protein [Clostridia bacterium]